MDNYQRQFIDKAKLAAQQSGHIFPAMAACEAALESGYGTSGLAIQHNNLFGMKQHHPPIYGTVSLPTWEVINGQNVHVSADWVSYPDWATCFQDRMATLKRLHSYPNYAAALAAATPIEYITAVSKTWSTDPKRGDKVINIYHAYIS